MEKNQHKNQKVHPKPRGNSQHMLTRKSNNPKRSIYTKPYLPTNRTINCDMIRVI